MNENIERKNNKERGCVLTVGVMALIESVVNRTNLTDTNALIPEVCDELVRRYGVGHGNGDKKLNYHLTQMRLRTTMEIRRAIECFFISQKLFPNKSYLSA